jgi:large subunit ribosomal protein L25
MSEQAVLKVEQRTETGKGAARRIRASGKIPGNVYGHGEEPTAVQADALQFKALISRISTENTLVDLEVDGAKPRAVLIREIQRHPYRADILHVDFFEITAGEKIRVAVPVHLTGTAKGVKNGGILQVVRHEIELECLPRDIPQSFEADVSDMEIGDSLHIEDLDTGDVTLLEDASLTVCTVVAPKVVAVEEEEAELEIEGLELLEEGEEPEVITARGDDEEEEEE